MTYHLETHPEQHRFYLSKLAELLEPDTRSLYEHFLVLDSNRSEEESSRRLDESIRNRTLNRELINSAGDSYRRRDSAFLKNDLHIYIEKENDSLFEYIHKSTNKNVGLGELLGTNHPFCSDLRLTYKKSKCLVENTNDITIDLQRLLCRKLCYFDPKLYGNCMIDHNGDIALFGNEIYQNSFPNFKNEIEKYPEFMGNKSVDTSILKSVKVVEKDRVALVEMNRLLKIILSLLTVQKDEIKRKLELIISESTDENHLMKPVLGIHLWGPKYSNMDNPDDYKNDKKSLFSTFTEVDVQIFKNPPLDMSLGHPLAFSNKESD